MIYRNIKVKELPQEVSLTKKEYYLLLLHETHVKDFTILLGQGIKGQYSMYREAVPKMALNEFIFPSGWKQIEPGALLVHKDLLKPFWVKMRYDGKNKIVLPISDKLFNTIGVSRNELTSKYNCAVLDPSKDQRVIKDYPL